MNQPPSLLDPAPRPRPREFGRRFFIVSAAWAVSGLAFFALRRTTVPALRLPNAPGGPSQVTVVRFDAYGNSIGEVTIPRVVKTDEEWRRQLSEESYRVARMDATEPSFTGATWNLHARGIYHCICCDLALFHSNAKFDSGTGWPSFFQPIAPENIIEILDGSLMVVRTAVSCRLCDAHLGHVFNDGPQPTGRRYCMNSAAMRFASLA